MSMGRAGCLLLALFTALLAGGFESVGRELPSAGTPPPPAVAATHPSEGLVAGINAFASDLYRLFRADPQAREANIFFSPLSIQAALGVTYAGARGETAGQMRTALRLGTEDDRFHEEAGALLGSLNLAGKEGAFRLDVVNAIWGRKGETLLDSFLTLSRRAYQVEFERLDFRGDPRGSRRTINRWVAKRTGGKIRDLLPAGIIQPETSLVLTNAVYFKADWMDPFKKKSTRRRPFRLGREKEISVPTMYQRALFNYAESSELQMLELLYAGGRMSMVILLPRAVDGLSALEQDLDSGVLSVALRGLDPTVVKVYLPRFRFESAFKLKDELSALGMSAAFRPRVADFSGINGVPPPDDGCLYLQEAVHKALVAVDEKGTEAAAATAVVVAPTASIPRPSPEFVADHPFLFLIRDRISGVIVFMGRVVDPKS